MVGTLTNQNPARRARKACMARKVRNGVGKNSIDLIGCGGTLTNQNPARRVHKVRKGVGGKFH